MGEVPDWFEKAYEGIPKVAQKPPEVNSSRDDHLYQCSDCDKEREAAPQEVVTPSVRQLLLDADAAIEKSRGLLRRCRERFQMFPVNDAYAALIAEITDLLGD